jgi:thiol-disulfide isomerase/thioredoxin
MKIIVFIVFIVLLLYSEVPLLAQQKKVMYPQIGMPCPDILFQEVHHYDKNRIRISDFKGRWLILDLFSTGCRACFQSFPKVNQLQKDFKGKVQFLLVGRDDNFIRDAYEKFRTRLKLDLAIAFDTLSFYHFGVKGVPHLMVIDDKGIVRAITSSLTKTNIQDFLNGKK